jgi:DNA-binding transcriptional regulator YhcF (GntR family)
MAPTAIRLRDDGSRPSAQVREAVIRAIERGALLPGDRLPTVRALAEDLALAPNTVARAYRELEEQGWLVGRGRAGTYVTARPPLRPPAAERELERAADRYLRRAAALGFDRDAAAAALRRA